MSDRIIAQRLFGSDIRNLSCRRHREASCSRVSVLVNGTGLPLCPVRVDAFLADATSLAGLQCEPASDPREVEDGDLP